MKNGWTGFNRSLYVFLLAAALLATGCAGSDTVRNDKVPTLKTFEGYYPDIWKTTFSAVQKQNLPVKVASVDNGFMASDWVEEVRTIHDKYLDTTKTFPSRYRVNVSLRRMPAPNQPKGIERVTVTVNKQFEIKDGDRWRAFPSDLETETAIIAAIGRELGQ